MGHQRSICLELPYGYHEKYACHCGTIRALVLTKSQLCLSVQLCINVSSWNMVGGRPLRFKNNFKRPHRRSKVIQKLICHRNVLWRTPDQSVMHHWGQRSCRGQPGSTRDQFTEVPYGYQIWSGEPWAKRSALLGSKVMQGSPGSTRGQIAQMPNGDQMW